MFRDMGLDKERASIRIQSTTDVDNGRLHDSRLHHLGIKVDGNGMVIDDTVDTIIVIDQGDPVLYSPEIVTDMDFPRWLNPAKNPLHIIPLGEKRPWVSAAHGLNKIPFPIQSRHERSMAHLIDYPLPPESLYVHLWSPFNEIRIPI
jgi:hypothetical protein